MGRSGCHCREAVRSGLAAECLGEGYVIGGAVMVDVVGLEDCAGEFLEKVRLFVGQAIGTDDADALAALAIAEFTETLADVVEG